MSDLIGKTLGQYQILREIGRGGMAIVYEAYQPLLARRVAIKMLLPQLSADPSLVKRFLQEARSAANLTHPHIVTIHDVVEQDGQYWIVMQHLPGLPLSQVIQQGGRLPLRRAAHIVAQIASALDYAHAHGVVHRDVKAANIIVNPNDHATLTDFGIARAAETSRLTYAGMVVGTPEYMAPEQAQGEPAGPASDIYALGIVAYEALTGQLPFQATTAPALLYKHVHERPVSPRAYAPELPAGVERVFARALAKRPAERYSRATELARALETLPAPRAAAVSPPRGVQPVVTRVAAEETRLIRRSVPVEGEKPAPPPKAAATVARRRALWLWPVAVAAALVLVFVVALLSRQGQVATPPTLPAASESGLIAALLTATPSTTPQESTLYATATLAGTVTFGVPTRTPTWPPTATPRPATFTPTGAPSATFTPTEAPLSTFTPTGAPSATFTPTEAPSATFTPQIAATVTPAPTATARLPTPTFTAQPVVLASPTGYPAPILRQPEDGGRAESQATFTWDWPGPPLTADQGFEVRIWKEGQPDHYGAAEPVRDTRAVIDMRSAYGVRQGGGGAYFWTVALVRTAPKYARIGPEAPPRTLNIGSAGGGGGEAPPPTWTPPSP